MVGFIGALAGGAASGWSKGQLESIKAKREEKLKMLDMEFQRSENALTRGIQEKQIASQEKLTLSSQALQERLGNLQAETTKEVAKLGATVDRERIGSSEKIAQLQVDSNKLLTQMQIDANNTPTLIQTQTGWAWQKKDGTMMEAPIDPATGKPLDPLVNKDDTPAIANYKFLSALPGMTPAEAMRLSFESEDSTADDMYKDLLKANIAAETSDFATITPEQTKRAEENTKLQLENWQRWKAGLAEEPGEAPGATPAPAAGDPAAAAPAVPSSAGDTTVPHETLLKQAVDGINNGTLKREDVRKKLLLKGVPEAKIKAAGI